MSTYVVRPTSVVTNGGGTTPSTQATVLTNLGDNSDLTTVVHSSTSSIYWTFGLGAPTIAADEYVARVGSFIRWKDGGSFNGQVQIGARAYRAADAAPAVYTLGTDGRTTPVTSELGYEAVTWSVADCASLRYRWYDGRYSTGPTVTTYELGASIYTIKRASATSANTTITTSAYPTIATSTVATLDWEASLPAGSAVRNIGTQVWIESGGTGVGTGTFIATKSVTTVWNATGTLNQNITMDTAVPNGTYKIYVRTIRYRDNYQSSADTISAWSTAYTLTMNVPPPTAPTFTITTDGTLDRVTLNVTPVATTSYANPKIYVFRSTDSFASWDVVRGANGAAATFGVASVIYDYEAPRGVTVQYRAQVEATYSSLYTNVSAYSTVRSGTLAADTWNLKVIADPALNDIDVRVTDKPDEEMTEDLGVFRPMDRQYPVVVSGSIGGWDGGLSLVTSTAAEWASLKAILECQEIVFLESPFGWTKYIRILSGSKTTLSGTATVPIRNIQVSYVEVAAPNV